MTIDQLENDLSLPSKVRLELHQIHIAQLRLELHELQVMYNSSELHTEDVRLRIEEIQQCLRIE